MHLHRVMPLLLLSLVLIVSCEGGPFGWFREDSGPWSAEWTLRAADAQADDWFGVAVAASGASVIVGAQNEDGGAGAPAPDAGAAYVFSFDGTEWVQEAALRASDGAELDRLGWSVSIAGDTAIAGAINGGGGPGFTTGAAYLFRRSGSSWEEEAVLTPSDGQDGDFFGMSVAVSGNYAIVGADGEDGGAGDPVPAAGAAYVFHFDGSSWNEQAILRASDGQELDTFGGSVSIDGDFAVVGARGESGGDGDPVPDSGAVYVFRREGSAWIEEAILRATNAGEDDWFGGSVAISGDTIIAGASWEDGGAGDPLYHAGAAYVFVRSGSSWIQETVLRAADAQSRDGFGASVDIAGDRAIISAPGEDGGEGDPAADSGAVYIFARDGSTWTEEAVLRASDGRKDDGYGTAVAISSEYAVTGSASEDGGEGDPIPESGAVYVYQ